MQLEFFRVEYICGKRWQSDRVAFIGMPDVCGYLFANFILLLKIINCCRNVQVQIKTSFPTKSAVIIKYFTP